MSISKLPALWYIRDIETTKIFVVFEFFVKEIFILIFFNDSVKYIWGKGDGPGTAGVPAAALVIKQKIKMNKILWKKIFVNHEYFGGSDATNWLLMYLNENFSKEEPEQARLESIHIWSQIFR